MTDENRVPTPRGELELALLTELWSMPDHTASGRALHDRIGASRGIVYTTVTKVLDRLVEKGLVTRRREGRAFVYTSVVQRAETQRAMVRKVVGSIIGDDPQPAVAALIGAVEDISTELLEQLRAELETRKGRE